MSNVRARALPCYDRLVVDVAGDVGGYTVAYCRYVVQDRLRVRDPDPRRHAALQITVNDPAYDANYQPDVQPGQPARAAQRVGLPHVPAGRVRGLFEGYTTVGLGVRARLPFRVFTLDGRARRPGWWWTSRTAGDQTGTAQQITDDRRGGLRGDAVIGAPRGRRRAGRAGAARPARRRTPAGRATSARR